jgi:hypothetical protein
MTPLVAGWRQPELHMHNERLEPRIPLDLPVHVVGATDVVDGHGVARDISETGMFVALSERASSARMGIGDTVSLRFELDGQAISIAAAEVMWRRTHEQPGVGPVGAGLRFVDVEDDSRLHLRRHVHAHTEHITKEVRKPHLYRTHRDLEDTQDLLPPHFHHQALHSHPSDEPHAAMPAPSSSSSSRPRSSPRAIGLLMPAEEFLLTSMIGEAEPLAGWTFRAAPPNDIYDRATVVPTTAPTPVANTPMTTSPHMTTGTNDSGLPMAFAQQMRRRQQLSWGTGLVAAGAACAALLFVATRMSNEPLPKRAVEPISVATAANVVVEPVFLAEQGLPGSKAPLDAPVPEAPPTQAKGIPTNTNTKTNTNTPVVEVAAVVEAPKHKNDVDSNATTAATTANAPATKPKPREWVTSITGDATVSRAFVLHAPERVVVDLTGDPKITPSTSLPTGVEGVRTGVPAEGVSRVVLALSDVATTAKATIEDGKLRVRY